MGNVELLVSFQNFFKYFFSLQFLAIKFYIWGCKAIVVIGILYLFMDVEKLSLRTADGTLNIMNYTGYHFVLPRKQGK